MSEGVCVHELVYDDSQRATDYRILDVNPEYEAILGLAKADVVGRLASEARIHPEIKVIYMSGYADDVIAGRGIMDQSAHFVNKPFAVETLLEKVRTALKPQMGK